MSQANQVRTYDPTASVVFLKTNERFGGLSNMAPGFPLRVNEVHIRTSEALYQACRFPHMPDVQRKIIDEHSPMTAKMRSKPFLKDSRPDWDAVRVKIMRWCLRVKLAQNWREFGRLLLATGDRPIVEQSRKDDFWGAKVAEDGSLVGMNVLGRLLMELREQLKGDEAESLRSIEPLAIPEFLLFQRPIEMICTTSSASRPVAFEAHPSRPVVPPPQCDLPQPTLFEQPMTARGQMDIQQNSRPAAAESNKDPKRYSGYRDSGLPWLGQIPQHWDVRRNGRVFAERNQTGFGDLPILEVSLRTGVRVRDMENGARKQQMTDRSKYKRAAKGDIAYNMMRMWQGAVGVAPVDGLISPAYVVARPFPEIEPRYYAYVFRTDAYMREVNKFSRGIVSDRNRLYWDEFKQMPSAFPPADEQTRIADFLDAQGRLTARLIRNKRRLIGLLNEQKQAITNQAVTRGLNRNAPMKATGIDWMPEVPAHWEILQLRRISTSRCDGPFGSGLTSAHYRPSGVRVVRLQNIGFSTFKDVEAAYISQEHYNSLGNHDVFPGDLIIAGLGDNRIPAGRACVAPGHLGPSMVKADCFRFRLDKRKADPSFMALHLTATAFSGASALSTGATRQRINLQSMSGRAIALPPLAEQEIITKHLSEKTAELDRAIERVETEITLIQEYRERLVADVVTGKLDVRHVEISAPADEPALDEDEALEEDLETDDAEVMEGTDADE
jgi:type I restriction enzyme S subunit